MRDWEKLAFWSRSKGYQAIHGILKLFHHTQGNRASVYGCLKTFSLLQRANLSFQTPCRLLKGDFFLRFSSASFSHWGKNTRAFFRVLFLLLHAINSCTYVQRKIYFLSLSSFSPSHLCLSFSSNIFGIAPRRQMGGNQNEFVLLIVCSGGWERENTTNGDDMYKNRKNVHLAREVWVWYLGRLNFGMRVLLLCCPICFSTSFFSLGTSNFGTEEVAAAKCGSSVWK